MEESTFSIIFSEPEDPRLYRTKRHKLLDIILMTICAVLRAKISKMLPMTMRKPSIKAMDALRQDGVGLYLILNI